MRYSVHVEIGPLIAYPERASFLRWGQAEYLAKSLSRDLGPHWRAVITADDGFHQAWRNGRLVRNW